MRKQLAYISSVFLIRAESSGSSPSRGRVCHEVLIFAITAMIVCIFEHVQWRWALNFQTRPRLSLPKTSEWLAAKTAQPPD
jgi:hypothetical protein